METKPNSRTKLAPLSHNRLSEGCTELMHACQQGNTAKIIEELRTADNNKIQKRDRTNKNTLHYCTAQKDLLPAATIAMTAPELMESPDEDGFTPLHLAVIQGNTSVVNLLIANKVDVNALDNEGHSVVHWATVCGEIEALRAVLAANAKVAIADSNGGTPLHYAAQMCGANYEGKSEKASPQMALDILKILLEHPDTNVSVEDKDGRQPLLWAASAGSSDAIIALINAGAYVESCDKDGLTALHCSASRGHVSCIDTLIKLCGAQTDLIDSNGCTALHYAVTLGHAEATSLLLDLGADPNRQDRKGRTPAHCACAKGQFETVKILGKRNANLWLRNVRGDLPVHEAAFSGRRDLVQWLLEQQPKHINTTSNDGRNLLHIAAGNDHSDMCKLLIDLGVDVNSIYRNTKNVVKTPLDCALQKGFRSTAKFIQMHGGVPASKLRLSGIKRTQNMLPELDEVQPLNIPESNTNLSRQPSNQSKRSDSDSDNDRSRRRRKSSKCHKRRTSSCSETFICHRVGSPCEVSRSKSVTDVSKRRKSRKQSQTSSSSSSSVSSQSESSSDDEEECCVHVKRKSRCYKKTRSKSKDKDGNKKKKSGPCRKGSESSDKGDNDDDKKKKDKKKDSKKDTKSSASKSKSDSKSSSRPSSSAKRKNSSSKKGSKEETDSSKKNGDASEDDKGAKEIVTQVEVHKENANPQTDDDGVMTDATYTVEKKESNSMNQIEEEKTDAAGDNVKKVSFKNGDAAKMHEQTCQRSAPRTPQKTQDDAKAHEQTCQRSSQQKAQQEQSNGQQKRTMSQEDLSKIHEQTCGRSQPRTPQRTPTKTPDQNRNQDDQSKMHQQNCQRPSRETQQYLQRQDQRIDDDFGSAYDDSIMRPKSQTPDSVCSFTVLGDGDDAQQKLLEFEQMTAEEYTDGPYMEEQSEQSEDPIYVQPKRRSRSQDIEHMRILEEQGSKDIDSGFEPSPRSTRSKIPAPQSFLKSMTATPRKAFPVIENSRPRSNRPDGRKPGDKNAVNMSTVSQSIQKNIRRYYMERKIFQHLLELKSLQIRSTKMNEGQLVKRAVDDYHKSVNDMGFEIGGVPSKFPYREYTFKNFELFLYDTLKSLQKPGTFNFQNLSEVYREAERRLSPDYGRSDKALYCTTKTHRCLHATHAYTGIPCAAYIPMMNHHTMPKLGFGKYKPNGSGNVYLPKIMSGNRGCHSKVSLEFSHGNDNKLIPLPSNKDSNKRYYVQFTLKDNENNKENYSEDDKT